MNKTLWGYFCDFVINIPSEQDKSLFFLKSLELFLVCDVMFLPEGVDRHDLILDFSLQPTVVICSYVSIVKHAFVMCIFSLFIYAGDLS